MDSNWKHRYSICLNCQHLEVPTEEEEGDAKCPMYAYGEYIPNTVQWDYPCEYFVKRDN